MPQPHPSEDQARAFGERLRAARADMGWSQEKVALSAGISLQHLSLLERGLSDRAKGSPANPRLGVLLNLAKTLGTDLDELLGPLHDSTDPHGHDPAHRQAPQRRRPSGEEGHHRREEA